MSFVGGGEDRHTTVYLRGDRAHACAPPYCIIGLQGHARNTRNTSGAIGVAKLGLNLHVESEVGFMTRAPRALCFPDCTSFVTASLSSEESPFTFVASRCFATFNYYNYIDRNMNLTFTYLGDSQYGCEGMDYTSFDSVGRIKEGGMELC